MDSDDSNAGSPVGVRFSSQKSPDSPQSGVDMAPRGSTMIRVTTSLSTTKQRRTITGVLEAAGSVSDLPEKDVMELKSIFDLVDYNARGEVELEELFGLLDFMRADDDDDDEFDDTETEPLMMALRSCEAAGMKTVDFKTFVMHVTPILMASDKTQESLRRAWDCINQGDDVTLPDLLRVSRNYTSDISEQELKDMLAFADSNSNGYVSFDEFYKLMIGQRTRRDSHLRAATQRKKTRSAPREEQISED
eukprot:TRINITY_DN16073_c0_g1_i1.p1 TRINITY_DN16073_c0_g1~~TRINITY_DN16073_c0_g1_i1.p1  ORF type:complete len:249 (-),score=66.05 TRINITY_DN16073_c0_g1_i1:162-908(-)